MNEQEVNRWVINGKTYQAIREYSCTNCDMKPRRGKCSHKGKCRPAVILKEVKAQKQRHRKPYVWGAKNFLSSMEIGETIEYKGPYPWKNLEIIASRMKRDYGCKFSFNRYSDKKIITREK